MKLEIEVKRIRGSVTQGVADVYVNGEKVIQFADDIQLIKPDQEYYGEKIEDWASTKPDSAFIKGLLWNPLDDVYHYSDKVKKILESDTKCKSGSDCNIVLTNGIRVEIELRQGFKKFVDDSIQKFLNKDWGYVSEMDVAVNNDRPLHALGAYEFEGDVRIWIKQDYDVITVLLPEEY